MKSIYIAGKMRGNAYFAFPEFMRAENFLKQNGWDVINPAKIDLENGFNPYDLPDDYDWNHEPDGMDVREVVRRDVLAIVDKCCSIYMLRGWEYSTGAVAEHALAKWLQMEIIYE